METLALYLVKSAVWLSGFTFIYMLFLRRERFFLLKRIYLITGILVSIFFPFVTLHYAVEVPAAAAPAIQMPEVSYAPAQIQDSQEVKEVFDYTYLLAGTYLAGIIFLVVRNMRQFRHLFKSIKKSPINRFGPAKLIRTPEYASSFSFFNYVFVNPSISEEEVKEIMNHELVHVKQKHWVDLVLGELMRMLQWANPFAWIYTGFIRLNHEYLADEEALQCSSDPALYKAALLNQLFRSPVISLSNSFNYSITKTRFDMMKKLIESPYRKLKALLILPVFPIIFYAFSTPEYHYSVSTESDMTPFTIPSSSPVRVILGENTHVMMEVSEMQKGLTGTVKDADGKPIPGAVVIITGTTNGPVTTTNKEGIFNMPSIPKNSVFVTAPGYKPATFEPGNNGNIEISLEKDPDYKPLNPPPRRVLRAEPLVVIDGEITDRKLSEVRKELGHDYGTMTMLQGKSATDKYGERATNGVVEILTRKKAIEMGLNPSYPRIEPDDYPSFQGGNYSTLSDWVAEKAIYPEEAKSKGIQGWVTINYTIEKEGSVTVMPAGSGDPILREEIIRVLSSAPKFDPPKNPEANEPLNTGLTVKFKLPDQITANAPFVVVENMPMFPGGDETLLQFIRDNIEYPEELKKDKIEGRVILRFIVTAEGNTEGISVLKGVHPLLDAEAVRVVSSLKGWTPGMQGGNPVNVWYMVPVNFIAPSE